MTASDLHKVSVSPSTALVSETHTLPALFLKVGERGNWVCSVHSQRVCVCASSLATCVCCGDEEQHSHMSCNSTNRIRPVSEPHSLPN